MLGLPPGAGGGGGKAAHLGRCGCEAIHRPARLERLLRDGVHPGVLPGLKVRALRAAIFFLWLLALMPVDAAGAQPLSAPTGEVILTVDGNIERKNSAEGARFDRQMLQALGVEKLRTSSPWTDGVAEFEGVPARAVMKAVGARGKAVIASALNDYRAEIPISDFEDYPVLFAFRMDGHDLTVRDRGPIWIVYPRDDFPELRNERVNSRWVWQLRGLTVE
jgi:hypothetical protein